MTHDFTGKVAVVTGGAQAPSRVIMLGQVRLMPVSLIGSWASMAILYFAAVSTTF